MITAIQGGTHFDVDFAEILSNLSEDVSNSGLEQRVAILLLQKLAMRIHLGYS